MVLCSLYEQLVVPILEKATHPPWHKLRVHEKIIRGMPIIHFLLAEKHPPLPMFLPLRLPSKPLAGMDGFNRGNEMSSTRCCPLFILPVKHAVAKDLMLSILSGRCKPSYLSLNNFCLQCFVSVCPAHTETFDLKFIFQLSYSF